MRTQLCLMIARRAGKSEFPAIYISIPTSLYRSIPRGPASFGANSGARKVSPKLANLEAVSTRCPCCVPANSMCLAGVSS
jgi:hypothetical protein